MDYLRAPLIVRDHRGFYVEGDIDALTSSEVPTFQYGCESMGFLIPVGVAATGSQWIKRISEAYSLDNPKTAEVVRVLGKGMLVEQFDDFVLLDRDGFGCFWGNDEQCKDYMLQTKSDCRKVSSKAASIEMQMPKAIEGTMNFYGVPGPLRIFPMEHVIDNPISQRIGEFLKLSPVNQEPLTPEQIADKPAQDELLRVLVASLGYGGTVTYAPPRNEPKPTVDSAGNWPQGTFPDAAQITHSMSAFLGNMIERGWDQGDPKNKVFLCRPAPIFNPLASLRAHESMVHPKLIGWQVPPPIVGQLIERTQADLSGERQSSRQIA